MPRCIAYGCSNNSGITQKGLGFFTVPAPKNDAEAARAARWLHNIGTGFTVETFAFGPNKRVCEEHFHPDCIKEDMRAKIMGVKSQKKLLVEGAVPTIFRHKIFQEINMNNSILTEQSEINTKQEMTKNILQVTTESGTITQHSSTCDLEISTPSLNEPGATSSLVKTQSKRRLPLHFNQPTPCNTPSIDLDSVIPTPGQGSYINSHNTKYIDGDLLTKEATFSEDKFYPDQSSSSARSCNSTITNEDLINERIFVVYESALYSLVENLKCRYCGQRMHVKEKYFMGTNIRIEFNCHGDHNFVWNSQPIIGKMIPKVA